ncbi:probable N-acetyltransferase HLS1 [Amborella trichopoda]|uniref:probable N-acetyltransferase HLS1 n=1 Tax=Amborella trichopoda TaxID=13333 RepID=UPI0005D3092D|nr:probable N-acetyltransferase HLS1 [Amborella trichopoda]|eukprot:XP_011620669.1 probable N-acetyltransferase HLS1 [Amborella trichopoda]
MGEEGGVLMVREFDAERDCEAVERVERECEVGPSGKMSLYTDLMGDPICRVRHSPAYLMLVAELGEEREIVGVIRGCIKTVTCGKKLPRSARNATDDPTTTKAAVPVYTKAAYILGLRVSLPHRRMGIGLRLVRRLESWFASMGAEYAYMATDSDNSPSLSLFTRRLSYQNFRTPSILVHPVHPHHDLSLSKNVQILSLPPLEAESLYRRLLSTTEFFPRDIDSVLQNKLNLGTFLALPSDTNFANMESFLSLPPESWAVLSVWNSKDVFRLQVRGASKLKKMCAKMSRVFDRLFPWLMIPSVPEVFRPFGLYFLYGLGGEGTAKVRLIRALCKMAHNMARKGGCGVVATEVGVLEPLRAGVPHWARFSCEEDLWCVKRLGEDYSDGSVGDWTKSAPGASIFVDPRDF